MKDEEKAKEIAEEACLKMADWKEQQIIKWLKEHINDYIVKGRDIDLMFEDLKQAL